MTTPPRRAISKSQFMRLTAQGVKVLPPDLSCDHQWEEQPGEPPMDVCVKCGAVRR
jgi:hypothetical protein